MKKIFFIITFVFIFDLTLPIPSFAQDMIGFTSSSLDNAIIQSQQQEEQKGKNFLDNLTNTFGYGQIFERLRYFCLISIARYELYAYDEYDVGRVVVSPWY
ncbi:MAG: hypothetical protein AAB629_00090 [Patescibacteria group bacterium]